MMMMARGTIVVDKNLDQLVSGLRDLNLHVIVRHPGESNKDLAERILVNRIFITRNTIDFLQYAPGLSIGLIGLESLKFIDTDPSAKNSTLQLIFDVIFQFKLWSKESGFYLELKPDGHHNFQEFNGS